ncbi:MAG: hypothetical protein QM635_05355 [Microbacteriaceae bacterium]
MSVTLTLPGLDAVRDLETMLGRAARVEDGAVRLIASGGVLAVYVAVFFPVGLLDESPTILGLRTFRVAERGGADLVVPIASLLARLEGARATAAEGPVSLQPPHPVNTVTWAAISPPRGGWVSLGSLDAALLRAVAQAGVEQIADAVPDAVGGPLVHRARSSVWSRPLREAENVPAGAAFAASSLGFLGDDEPVALYGNGPWTRLTTRRGHVLVKHRGWTMAR